MSWAQLAAIFRFRHGTGGGGAGLWSLCLCCFRAACWDAGVCRSSSKLWQKAGMEQTTYCTKMNNKCLKVGGWSSSFSQELLKAYCDSKCCKGRNVSYLDALQSSALGCLALGLVEGGQVLCSVTWARWLGGAQSNSGRGSLGEAQSPLGCC